MALSLNGEWNSAYELCNQPLIYQLGHFIMFPHPLAVRAQQDKKCFRPSFTSQSFPTISRRSPNNHLLTEHVGEPRRKHDATSTSTHRFFASNIPLITTINSQPSCQLQSAIEEIQNVASDISDVKDIATTTAQANYCLLHRIVTTDVILSLRVPGRRDRGRNDTFTQKMSLQKAVMR